MPKSIIKAIPLEELQEIIKNSLSKREVLTKLGYSPTSGGANRVLTERIKNDEIDISHFGTPVHKNYIPLEEILVENSTYSRCHLKNRLVEEKVLEYKCAECGNTGEWNGKKLNLQLDHINGINNDNRKENLRFLCPNCHAQTETFCKKQAHQKIFIDSL